MGSNALDVAVSYKLFHLDSVKQFNSMFEPGTEMPAEHKVQFDWFHEEAANAVARIPLLKLAVGADGE